MFHLPDGAGVRTVEVKCVDNGWIVIIQNPPPAYTDPYRSVTQEMLSGMATILPEINRAGGRGAVEGIDEAMDSYKENDEAREVSQEERAAKLQQKIKEHFEKGKTETKKPIEIYAFLDVDKMMAFLREALTVQPVGV